MSCVYLGNGILKTMAEQGTIENGGILIEDGRIVYVGEAIMPPEPCIKVDARGGYIMPGLIDAHSHIGIFESGIGEMGVDGNEDNCAITPQMRGIDGVNPMDPEFTKAYQNGVTLVATGPGSANPIGGQFAALHTRGRTIEEMLVKEPLAMKMAFGENPKKSHGSKGRLPGTRMGVAALIRETLYKAKEYAQKKETEGGVSFDLGMEALVPVIKGELLVKAHAHRADDIMTALRIAEEFHLKMTIEHCSEGHLLAEELAAKGNMVILGPYLGFPHKNEVIWRDEAAAGILEKAGVELAIMTDLPAMHEESLRISAGLCHQKGLSEEGAFRAITIYAAKSLGLDQQYGSLEVGKAADIVIFDKNPITCLEAKCIFTMIEGQCVFSCEEIGKEILL
ncbi:amidohydrolase [Clostridiales bacterium COT073_COT-073]|nr:amidohydrolase [Clostridiales bacterium COT073_COT-073]